MTIPSNIFDDYERHARKNCIARVALLISFFSLLAAFRGCL